MDPNEALSLLSSRLDQHGLSELGWTGALDNTVGRFGTCSLRKKRISLSRHLASINSDEETLDTVLHEIAHALTWVEHNDDCGHDERWQAIAARIGARPERTVDAEEVNSVAGAFYLVHSETGEVFGSYYKRPPERNLASRWIRGRRAETEGKLTVITARELARLQGDDDSDENPNLIHAFEQRTVKALSAKLNAAVAAVCEEHGLSVELVGRRWNTQSYHCGYEIRMSPDNAAEGDRADFATHAHLFSLSADDFGRRFTSNKKTFALVGFKPQNRKYPVIGRDDAGTRYKFPAAVLESLE